MLVITLDGNNHAVVKVGNELFKIHCFAANSGKARLGFDAAKDKVEVVRSDAVVKMPKDSK